MRRFFLVCFRHLIIHHTTLVFRSGCHPESSCLVIKHRNSFNCLKGRRVLSCHGVGTSVHDCLRSNSVSTGSTVKQLLADINGFGEGVEEAASGRIVHMSSGWCVTRRLHELAWLINCFPPHPVESLLDRAPGAV